MNSDTSNSIHIEANAARIPQLDAGAPAAAAFAEGDPTDISASGGGIDRSTNSPRDDIAGHDTASRPLAAAEFFGAIVAEHNASSASAGASAETEASACNTLPTRPPSVLASISALLDAAEARARRAEARLAVHERHCICRAGVVAEAIAAEAVTADAAGSGDGGKRACANSRRMGDPVDTAPAWIAGI